MTKLVREISHASYKQSSGIEQVSIAVNQMDEAAQQNAALVERVSSCNRFTGRAVTVAGDSDSLFRC